MLRAKFSLEEMLSHVLSHFKNLEFKDKSAMLRAAIKHFRKKMAHESLKKSADLYSEIYSTDDDLKGLTETALNGWPK